MLNAANWPLFYFDAEIEMKPERHSVIREIVASTPVASQHQSCAASSCAADLTSPRLRSPATFANCACTKAPAATHFQMEFTRL